MMPADVTQRGFVLGPTEGRFDVPLNVVGEPTLVKVSAADTGGAVSVFQLTAPRFTGPPLHVHTREDETFYVLSGEVIFEIDGTRVTTGAGSVVFLPRGIPHRYQNFSDLPAELLLVVTPGTGFEAFFGELAAATPPQGGVPPMDVLSRLDAQYGLTTLGPPMFE
jgi:quercetin dioxygenase-like cupin family protein